MDKRRASIHEAGHLAMALHLNLPIEFAEINPIEGGKWKGTARVKLRINNEKHHNNILISLSGKVAEEIFYGEIDYPIEWCEKWTGAGDYDNAFKTAYEIVSSRDEVVQYVKNATDEVRQTLVKYKKDIDVIAVALEAKERLQGPEVLSLVLGK